MSLFEAKIDCVVERPFVYGSTKYEKGDIFKYNPNSIHLKKLYQTKRFYELPDSEYKLIICCSYPKKIAGEIYKKGDELEFGIIDDKTIMLLVRRGSLKKVLKQNKVKTQPKEIKPTLNDKQTTTELIVKDVVIKEVTVEKVVKQPKVDNKITLSTIAKKADIKPSILKPICNEDLKMNIGSYTQVLTSEQEELILSHLNKGN